MAAPAGAFAQLTSSEAKAVDPAQEQQQKEQARLLFNEGLHFVEQEDWVQAEDRFRSVLVLRASHVVAYNLASALTHLGRLMEAVELLRAIVRDPSAESSAREAAQQLLIETEQRIGVLTLRVSGDTQGALVQLDGNAVELSEQILTISVDPGEHTVVVERDRQIVASETVQVGGDAPLQVSVTLSLPPRVTPVAVARAAQPPAAARNPAASAVASTAREPRRDEAEGSGDSIFETWWFWTAVGAVAAGGTVTGLLIANRGPEDPVAGDTEPGVVRGTVEVMR